MKKSSAGFRHFPRNLPDKFLIWLGYAVLIGLLAGLYFDSALDLPLQSHDADTFRDNEAISRDFAFFFSTDKQQVSGRPTAEFFKWSIWLVGGNDPTWFHLCSVGLHVLAAGLLALWGRRSGASMAVAMTGGLLFLVQVGHYQAVHHISALDYPLALAFGLGALLCWQVYLERGRPAWLVGVYLLLIFGVMAHQAVAAAWALCLVWAWMRGALGKEWWKLLPAGGVLAVISIGLLIITPDNTHVRGSVETYGQEGAWALVGGMGRLLLWFLSRLLTTAHWLPIQIREQYAWEPFLGALVLAGLLVLVWKRVWPPALWAAWTLLALLPFVALTEQLVHSSAQTSGRYLYMASAGTALLGAWLLGLAAGRLGRGGRYFYALVLVFLMGSSYMGLRHSEALTLYAAGRRYIGRGEIETGIEVLRRALEREPDALPADAFIRYGSQLLARGEDARIVFRQGLARFPQDLNLRAHLAITEREFGEFGPIHKLVEQVREEDRESHFQAFAALVYHNLGVGYMRTEAVPRAVLAFSTAQALGPDRANTRRALEWALFDLGTYYLRRGEVAQARKVYGQAVGTYGADAGGKAGIPAQLWQFIAAGFQVQACRQILAAHWPESR